MFSQLSKMFLAPFVILNFITVVSRPYLATFYGCGSVYLRDLHDHVLWTNQLCVTYSLHTSHNTYCEVRCFIYSYFVKFHPYWENLVWFEGYHRGIDEDSNLVVYDLTSVGRKWNENYPLTVEPNSVTMKMEEAQYSETTLSACLLWCHNRKEYYLNNTSRESLNACMILGLMHTTQNYCFYNLVEQELSRLSGNRMVS